MEMECKRRNIKHVKKNKNWVSDWVHKENFNIVIEGL